MPPAESEPADDENHANVGARNLSHFAHENPYAALLDEKIYEIHFLNDFLAKDVIEL